LVFHIKGRREAERVFESGALRNKTGLKKEEITGDCR
jgi:hypothetical protein